MVKLRPSASRGYADHGWLKSFHSFSFDQYQDPEYTNYSALRVLNEDTIAGGAGFAMHNHRDMEIITYVLSGALRHQDSLGNSTVLKAGDVQCMSAGSGIRHSEMNADPVDDVHLLQIWILPSSQSLSSSYKEAHFSAADKANRWCLIASAEGNDGSVLVHQNVRIYATLLSQGGTLFYDLEAGCRAYLYVVKGEIVIDRRTLKAGDALMLEDKASINLLALESAELLLIDLP